MTNQTTKHTPGPWGLGFYTDGKGTKTYQVGPSPKVIAELTDFDSSDGASVSFQQIEAEANARLIAAAPELLEAAKQTLQALRNMAHSFRDDLKLPTVGHTKWGKQLEDAISRAEGR